MIPNLIEFLSHPALGGIAAIFAMLSPVAVWSYRKYRRSKRLHRVTDKSPGALVIAQSSAVQLSRKQPQVQRGCLRRCLDAYLAPMVALLFGGAILLFQALISGVIARFLIYVAVEIGYLEQAKLDLLKKTQLDSSAILGVFILSAWAGCGLGMVVLTVSSIFGYRQGVTRGAFIGGLTFAVIYSFMLPNLIEISYEPGLATGAANVLVISNVIAWLIFGAAFWSLRTQIMHSDESPIE